MRKRFSEGQIIGFLKAADAGVAIKELCRRHGFSEASYYLWRSKFGGPELRPRAHEWGRRSVELCPDSKTSLGEH